MASATSWTETILFSLVFVTIFGIVIAGMNGAFHKSFDIPIVDNGTQKALEDYMPSAKDKINEGRVKFDSASGVTLESSFGLVKELVNIIWDFLTGSWINDIIEMLHLGPAGQRIAIILRILYFISMVLIVLYLLFKVKP